MATELICGDCLGVMRGMADSSVNLILTDPPYFRVKDEAWDRQWDTADGFIAWMGTLAAEWQRILAPNGSLYVFASPKMAARVEVEIGKRFNVLNRIRWVKDAGWHNKARKEDLRSFLSPWEEIIFAEHYGADNIAKGEAGYGAKCDELRGFVFEPLRAYLDGERERAGVTREQVNAEWQIWRNSPKGGMASHWFSDSQWELPTERNYQWLREVFARLNHGGDYLRREYEDLRRPFSVTADVPYTDVWTFPAVQSYEGKHPCEQQQSLLQHVIQASSRPGDLVADFFMGSGATARACLNTGRNFVGCDNSEHWYNYARRRIEAAQAQPRLFQEGR